MIDARAIASAGVPVLCVDTCSILDIMRDPTRESVRAHESQSAVDLVVAAEAGKVVLLAAEQVKIEFDAHDQSIQSEAERSLRKMLDNIKRINLVYSVYGKSAVVDLTHLDDYVSQARKIVERWLVQLKEVKPSSLGHSKAFARMNAGLAPAKRGKESSKDCLVYETYIETVAALRSAGVLAPIAFVSSNTQDYLTEGKAVRPEIASDFSTFKLIYAPNMSAAKHSLGIK